MISASITIFSICAILLIPITLSQVDAGGGIPVLSSSEFLNIESGFILPIDSNSIFMQHQIINDYGEPIAVVVSSFRSVDFDLIDAVCNPMIIYPQQMMLIPYETLDLNDYNKYTMLPALLGFKNPSNNDDEEIFIKKYELLLDDGANTNFSQTIDFSCNDITVVDNPKYERTNEDALGMQSRSQSGNQQSSGQQQSDDQSSMEMQSQQMQQMELLQQAQDLLQNYQQAGGYPNSALLPNGGPNLVDQNTANIREEIINEMNRNEEILQLLQQNSEFQLLDEQLSSEGLIQQPSIFTSIDEDEIEIDVPYENDNENAKIIASFVDDKILDVELVRPQQELQVEYFWIIPVLAAVIILVIIFLKKLSKRQSKITVTPPRQITVDNSINYVDITNQMLLDARELYKNKVYKDAHEKFGQAIRCYYSHHFDLEREMTNIETLQILRRNKAKHFDYILDFLNLCGMIEFAKHETDERKFYRSIDEFMKIIK